jgi:hypothetical protein
MYFKLLHGVPFAAKMVSAELRGFKQSGHVPDGTSCCQDQLLHTFRLATKEATSTWYPPELHFHVVAAVAGWKPWEVPEDTQVSRQARGTFQTGS